MLQHRAANGRSLRCRAARAERRPPIGARAAPRRTRLLGPGLAPEWDGWRTRSAAAPPARAGRGEVGGGGSLPSARAPPRPLRLPPAARAARPGPAPSPHVGPRREDAGRRRRRRRLPGKRRAPAPTPEGPLSGPRRPRRPCPGLLPPPRPQGPRRPAAVPCPGAA